MASASPVTHKFLMLKWVYIVPESDQIQEKMPCFDVSQVYDEENCYLNDYPGDLKLSEQDAKNFGFLIKLGYRVYFKCISSQVVTNTGRKYQAGFLCIRVPNSYGVEALEEFVKEQDVYTYRLLSYFPWPKDYLNEF